MTNKSVVLLLGFLAVGLAWPFHQPPPGPPGPPPPGLPPPGPPPHGPPPGGPFFPVYHQLTADQRHQLDQLLQDNRDKSKAEFKQALNGFKDTLSADLKKVLEEEKARFEEFRNATDKKAESLSSAAQDLYQKLKDIVADDSLTFKQEFDKAHELVKKADRQVLDEFRKNRVPLPGTPPPPPPPPPPHGGPLARVYGRLSPEQRAQLDQLMRNGRGLKKAEAKAQMDKFVAGLGEELKAEVAKDRAAHEQFKKDNDAKILKLGEEAKKVAQQIVAIMEDESKTFEQDHEQIRAVVDRASHAALDEIRRQRIPLPGVMPPPPPPPF